MCSLIMNIYCCVFLFTLQCNSLQVMGKAKSKYVLLVFSRVIYDVMSILRYLSVYLCVVT